MSLYQQQHHQLLSSHQTAPYTVPLYANNPTAVVVTNPNLVNDTNEATAVGAACNNKEVEIEMRLMRLFEFAKMTQTLRDETESAKNTIKSKIQTSFEDAHKNLRRLEDKLYSQIEPQIFDRIMEMSLRSIQYDLNQLIGKLTSMTLLSDRDHEFMMTYIDGSIRQLERNYTNVESYRRAELEKFTNGVRQDVNKLIGQHNDKINKFLETEYLNLNTDVKLKSKCGGEESPDDYREWLINDSKMNEEDAPPLKKENRSGSFDFVDIEKELDSIDVIEESDDDDDSETSPLATSKSNVNVNSNNDGVTRIFNEILNKPVDYWLLKANNSFSTNNHNKL